MNLTPTNPVGPYPLYHSGPTFEEWILGRFQDKEVCGRKILPVLWANIYNQRGGYNRIGLQNAIDRIAKPSNFTVSTHDDAIRERLPKGTVNFVGGGNAYKPGDYIIPLLVSPIPQADKVGHCKSFLASFVGSQTHPIRARMEAIFSGQPDTVIDMLPTVRQAQTQDRTKAFTRITSASWFCLCPRGYGPTSYRLYEALQLGSVPVIIYDNLFLPYTCDLDWEAFAVLCHESELHLLPDKLMSIPPRHRTRMIAEARDIYSNYFTFEAVESFIERTLSIHK